jgi:PTH1 family peptidyl-tRNA hydrolase
MRLFVGLGNPGSRHAGNRHNVGFMAVDAIARAAGALPWRRRFQGEATEAVLGSERVLILKPRTYMNESGRAVAQAQRFYKVPLGDVVVFHDELDLPPGKLRVKRGGGNAGHNGLRSITALCGSASGTRATRRWCTLTC